jgi:hypothetical protein
MRFKLAKIFNMFHAEFPVSSIYHWAILPEVLRVFGRRYTLAEPTPDQTAEQPT